jgi:hypothetical protein
MEHESDTPAEERPNEPGIPARHGHEPDNYEEAVYHNLNGEMNQEAFLVFDPLTRQAADFVFG